MHKTRSKSINILLGTFAIVCLVAIAGFTQSTPTITWTNPADITYGTLLSGTQLNATASVPGTFSYTPAAGSLLAAGDNQTLSVLFTPTDTVNYTTATASVLINVLKADAAIVVTPYVGDYDGTAHGATGTATGVLGEDLSSDLSVAGTTYTDVPGGTVAWSFTSTSGNYNDVASTDVTVVINKADVVIVVTPYDVVYDGTAHTATGTATGALSADRSSDLDLSGTTHTDAGAYSGDAWTFTDTTGNYNDASGTVDNNIDKADVVIVVTPYTVTYDGTAHQSTGTATGVGAADRSADLSLTGTVHTDAGDYTGDNWTFTDTTGNYNDDAGTVDNTINKANAVISVTPYSVTYDGVAHTSTGTATGVAAVDLSGQLDLSGTTHTDAGVYGADAWSFAGGTNYNDATGTVANSIAKANATIAVTPYNVVYDGLPHTATATATGVLGEDLSGDLDLSLTTHTDVGVYNADTWAFISSSGNYSDVAPTTITDTITAATAVIVVTPYDVVFDGDPHTVAATATGVLGEDLSADLTLPAANTNAGVYNGEAWSFTSTSGNYSPASGTVDNNIDLADATIVITPYDVVFDTLPHTVTATATGVMGEDLSAGLILPPANTNAGAYSGESWSFAYANYNADGGTVDNNIDKADAVIDPAPFVGDYDGAAHGAGPGTATGLSGPIAGLVVDPTTYTDVPGGPVDWVFTSADPNYNDDSGTANVVINKIAATISVPDVSFVYDGDPHGASGTATGVGAVDLSAFLSVGSNSYINVPGGPVAWSFSGSTNYLDESGSANVAITKADAVIVVTPYNVVYDGLPHSAVVATGVKGEDLSADVVGATHTDAGVYTADPWSFVDSTGNYNDNPGGTVDNNIDKADATIVVTPYDVVYDGVAHTAAATAVGVLGEDLSGDLDLSNTVHTDVGVYSADSWLFASTSGNYNDIAATTITNTITKADATIAVTPYAVVYDGVAHTAIASAIGVLGEDLSADLDLSLTTHTDAGLYPADVWSFISTSGNYNDVSGTISSSIAKADAVISVAGYVGVYDGASHGAVGSAFGVEPSPADLSYLLDLGSSFVQFPGGTANWSFAGNGNYNSASGSVRIDIYVNAVVPAGMGGPGQFLDEVLALSEGEQAPMVGLLPLAAIHEIGDIVTGACTFLNRSGNPTAQGLMHVFVSSVTLGTDSETTSLLNHWMADYDFGAEKFVFSWDTTDLLPGYYDVRLFFGDPATAEVFRIQLVEPSP